MAGKIWFYDCYDIRKFKPGDIHTFVDIGAQVGSVTIQAKVLNPTARVLAFEPDIITFGRLQSNMKQWLSDGIECYNIALGNGTPMCFGTMGGRGTNRFYTEDEKQWWPENSYTTESKTLPQIFKDYNISRDKSYVIKVDCEGGERFFHQKEFEEETLEIVRGSTQTMMELHFPFGGKKDQWNSWFKKLEDTHELREGGWIKRHLPYRRYGFSICNEIKNVKGYLTIELVNRKLLSPWGGKDILERG